MAKVVATEAAFPRALNGRLSRQSSFLRRRSNRSWVQGNLPVPSRSGWRFRTCGRPVRKQWALRYADAHFPGFLKARSRGLFRGPSWALEYCRAHARAGACNPHGSRDSSLWPHVTLMYSNADYLPGASPGHLICGSLVVLPYRDTYLHRGTL